MGASRPQPELVQWAGYLARVGAATAVHALGDEMIGRSPNSGVGFWGWLIAGSSTSTDEMRLPYRVKNYRAQIFSLLTDFAIRSNLNNTFEFFL